MNIKPSDLAMCDWLGLRPEEQEQALADLRALAAERAIATNHRRGRALNIMASYFHFITERR